MSVVAQPLFRTGGGRFPAILKAARWHHRRASPSSGIRAPRIPVIRLESLPRARRGGPSNRISK
jgi:hypothetical protein